MAKLARVSRSGFFSYCKKNLESYGELRMIGSCKETSIEDSQIVFYGRVETNEELETYRAKLKAFSKIVDIFTPFGTVLLSESTGFVSSTIRSRENSFFVDIEDFLEKWENLSVQEGSKEIKTLTIESSDDFSVDDGGQEMFLKSISGNEGLLDTLALDSSELVNYIGEKIVILKENQGWGSVEKYDVGVVNSSCSIAFERHGGWSITRGLNKAFVPLASINSLLSDKELKYFERGMELDISTLSKDVILVVRGGVFEPVNPEVLELKRKIFL